MRAIVAMSGGVDSSLAAALAVDRGWEAVGVLIHLSEGASRCCSIEDARAVARELGMRFYVVNRSEAFRREVMEAFADSYLAGETPIPCVACNRRFKFDPLLERARLFGAERIATGHYARVETDPETGLRRLRRGCDRDKDQSYFLFRLTQEQLARAWFPLGELSKDQVRREARRRGLATADKPDSQEICFVPGGDYAGVVEALRPAGAQPGAFVDARGAELGSHAGVHRYTVGQRRGLGLSAARPLYVTGIDAARGTVRVGGVEELLAPGLRLRDCAWIAGTPPSGPLRAEVQVRHRHAGAKASVEVLGQGGARVVFDEPVRAVAPGQAAVIYDGDVVVGGGTIAEALA
jgi:tRNA-specific 2-thiouridylase